MKPIICYGKLKVWKSSDGKDYGVDHWGAFCGLRPVGVKRLRLKCPECDRKVLSSVRACGDGCCLIHTLPPHKIKHWWKRKHKKKKSSKN